MFYRFIAIIILLYVWTSNGFAQEGISDIYTSLYEVKTERFNLSATRIASKPLRNKEKLRRKAINWFMLHSNEILVFEDDMENGVIKGRGSFIFENKITLRDKILPPRAAEKTDGKIYYTVVIRVTDSTYYYSFRDFNHKALNNFGDTSFGFIPKRFDDFKKVCEVDDVWCRLVYKEMVRQCNTETFVKILKINW